MALKLRLARGGRKNRPHYSIVVADSRMPRDGRFIEKVGTYNPLLKKEDENRVKLVGERITYWLGQGAKPSDRVARFLGDAGLAPVPAQGNNPQKAKPKAKAQEREQERQEKLEAAKAAEEEAKNAPAEEEAPAEEAAPAEETAEAEAPAEEAPAEAAEEAKADEPAAEEAPAEEEKKEE